MIQVLRLSHRLKRDSRVTSHVSLVARAFGASKIYYSGQHDLNLENSINNITKRFGGLFEITYIKNPVKLIREKKKLNYKIIHLTVYGLPIQNKIKEIRKRKNILLIVGSSKVPSQFYKESDLNISITSQPHSEVASICYFLDYYFKRKELTKTFNNAKVKIIPQKKGKKTTKFI